MSDRAIEILADAIPVDPDDGTIPIEYFAIDDRDGYGLVREWSVPETIAEKQLAALLEQGLVVIDTRDDATVELMAESLRHTVIAGPEALLGAPLREYWRELARAVLADLAKGGES